MEEKAVKKEEKKSGEQKNTPSYDELKMYCNQLLAQNRELTARLNTVMDIQNKLPYLFKVVEYSDKFPEDAVIMAKEEIISILGFNDEDNEGDSVASSENN